MITSLLLLYSSIFNAYPISPVYLVGLIERSDIIVYGEVISTEKISGEDYPSHIATIKVDQEMKRNISSSSILKVAFEPYMICPEPARYEKGKKVIAFLKKGKSSYFTVALSYGTKYRKKDVAEEYLTRIEKYLVIDDSDSPQKVNEKKVDWLIENLDFESTKFDAKQELTNLFRALYRCENHDDCNKMILDVAQLTPKQRTKLTSFAKESELISYQWDSALYSPLDEYYLEQVVDRMEAAVNQKNYYTVRNYISLLKDHGDANGIATKEEEWSECISDISNQETMLVTAKSLAKDIRGKYNFSASDRNAYMQLVPSNYERNKVRFKEKISVLKKY